MTATTETPASGLMICGEDDTARLARLARAAHEVSAALSDALVSLRNAIDRAPCGEAGRAETFDALRAFDTARHDADRRAGEVISHAVTYHGYY